MTSINIQDFQARLPAVLDDLRPGEELVITHDEKPLARVCGEPQSARRPRRPGNCAGMMTIISDDDDHLKDFAEYMG